jgi:2,3-bisphosphoglycerate-dependent phosphoglycerate mutase
LQFYFIRHGQSLNNEKYAREGTQFDRHPDPPMTDLGVRQTEALAEFLSRARDASLSDRIEAQAAYDFGFTHLYCSLMVRAVQTGSIISRALELPLVAWPETHERGGIYHTEPDSGEPVGLPGNSRKFLQEHFPELQLPTELGPEGWWGRPYESREQSRLRAQLVIDRLVERHGPSKDRVALVSHGGFFQEVMAAVLGIPTFGDHWLMQHNTGMARLDFSKGEFVLQYLNRLDWLTPDLIS